MKRVLVGVVLALMATVGILMMLLFLHLFVAPWRRFSRAIESAAFPEGPSHRRDQSHAWPPDGIIGASGRFW